MAARIEHVAARQVEWKTEAERATLAHLGSTLPHLLGGQQVEPAELIVGTEVAPCRARRALLPAWLVRGVAHVAPFALRAVPPRGSRAPSERPCVAHAMSPAWLLVYSTDRIRVLALAARHCGLVDLTTAVRLHSPSHRKLLMTLCSLLRRLLAATALAQAAFSSHGQGFDNVRFDVPIGRGDGIVGAAVINVPRYLGSDERKTRFFPLLDYRWSNGWFAGTGSGVGYNFSTRPSMQYGVRMTADFGRDEDDTAALRGLGDIDPAAEIGAFLNLRFDSGLFLRSALRYGSGNDHDGLVLDAGAGYGWMLAPRWRLGTGVNATYVNQSYMRQYFGVDTTQAARSGYPVY